MDHAIEAREKIAKERDTIQKKVMTSILIDPDTGDFEIDHAQDEQLKELLLDLDLQSLYAIPGINC